MTSWGVREFMTSDLCFNVSACNKHWRKHIHWFTSRLNSAIIHVGTEQQKNLYCKHMKMHTSASLIDWSHTISIGNHSMISVEKKWKWLDSVLAVWPKSVGDWPVAICSATVVHTYIEGLTCMQQMFSHYSQLELTSFILDLKWASVDSLLQWRMESSGKFCRCVCVGGGVRDCISIHWFC